MLMMKRAKLEEEKREKVKEREDFNQKCEYLNQLAYNSRKEQNKFNKIYHEGLHNESIRIKEKERLDVFKQM